MARTLGAAGTTTIEFRQKFDSLVDKHGDPVEVLFRLLKSRKQSIKIQAATNLLQYRYPKLAAAALAVDGPNQLSLSWDNDAVTIDAKPTDETMQAIEAIANSDQGEEHDDAGDLR